MGDDAAANSLEAAASSVFRYGKSVLRLSSGPLPAALPVALRETLPHLPTDKAVALVCCGNVCFPPSSDPEQLKALLTEGPSRAAAC